MSQKETTSLLWDKLSRVMKDQGFDPDIKGNLTKFAAKTDISIRIISNIRHKVTLVPSEEVILKLEKYCGINRVWIDDDNFKVNSDLAYLKYDREAFEGELTRNNKIIEQIEITKSKEIIETLYFELNSSARDVIFAKIEEFKNRPKRQR